MVKIENLHDDYLIGNSERKKSYRRKWVLETYKKSETFADSRNNLKAIKDLLMSANVPNEDVSFHKTANNGVLEINKAISEVASDRYMDDEESNFYSLDMNRNEETDFPIENNESFTFIDFHFEVPEITFPHTNESQMKKQSICDSRVYHQAILTYTHHMTMVVNGFEMTKSQFSITV
nr:hypothetical protein [Lysinibacillus timonensis]